MADNEINTSGGTVIGGGASAGRDVVGRDSIATYITLANLERLAKVSTDGDRSGQICLPLDGEQRHAQIPNFG